MKHKTDAELAQRTKVLLSRLAKEPKAPAIIGIAEVLFLQGKFKEVITRLRAVADVYEDYSYRYQMILGKTYSATGDLVRARRHFENALSIAPQSELAPTELIKIETSKPLENQDIQDAGDGIITNEPPFLPNEPKSLPEQQLFEKSIDFGYKSQKSQLLSEPPPQEKSSLNIDKTKISDALSNLTGKIQATGLPKAKAETILFEEPVRNTLVNQNAGLQLKESKSVLNAIASKPEQIEIPQHLRDALVGFSDDEIREFLKMDPSMANVAKPQNTSYTAEFPQSSFEAEENVETVKLPKGKLLDLSKVAAALPNISKNWKKSFIQSQQSKTGDKPKTTVFESLPKTLPLEKKVKSSDLSTSLDAPGNVTNKTPEDLQAEALRLLEAELGIALNPLADFEITSNTMKGNPDITQVSDTLNTQQDSISAISQEMLAKEFGASIDPLADFEKPVYAQDIPLPTSPVGDIDTSKLMEALKNLTPPPIPSSELRSDSENFFDQERLNQSLSKISFPNIPVPKIPSIPEAADANSSAPSNLSVVNFDELSKSLSKINLPPIPPLPEATSLDLDKLAESLSSLKLPPVFETGNPTPIEEQRKPFDDGDEIKTPTRSLAEIFTQQGALTKAIRVYEALQELEPEKRGEYGIMITGLRAQLMSK